MKLRVILIIGLFILCLSAPALADRVDYIGLTYGEDPYGNPRALNVRFDKVVESDASSVFSQVNYPPDQYKYISLYYTLINPSDKAVRYEFNVTLKDQANRDFHPTSDPAIDTVPAQEEYNRVLYFAVYRNSTNLKIVWTDKEVNPPWHHYDSTIDINFVGTTASPMASPAPSPTSTPTPTPPAPAQGCLPYLPIGLIIGCVGGLGLLARKRGPER